MARSSGFGTWSSLLLLEGLTLLGHRPHPALAHDVAQLLKPRLSSLTPADLARLLHCLAALGCAPQPAWLHQFFQHSSSKVPGLLPDAFAQVAVALSRCAATVVVA